MSDYGIKAQNVTAQNIAVGPGARIEQTGTGWSEQLGAALADLARAVAQFQGPPQTRDALLATHAEIAAEIASPTPDRGRLLARLSSLRELAGPATAIVQTAAALAQAVAAIH